VVGYVELFAEASAAQDSHRPNFQIFHKTNHPLALAALAGLLERRSKSLIGRIELIHDVAKTELVFRAEGIVGRLCVVETV
jgi:hypothetical protein